MVLGSLVCCAAGAHLYAVGIAALGFFSLVSHYTDLRMFVLMDPLFVLRCGNQIQKYYPHYDLNFPSQEGSEHLANLRMLS